MNTLRQNLEQGIPQVIDTQDIPINTMRRYSEGVEQSCLNLHELIYLGLSDGNPNITIFTDDEGEPDKYVSLKDKNGQPCYGNFVAGNSATDVGVRGVNPGFEGVINPTTVVHADVEALQDYSDRGAPAALLEAMDAVRLFNGFISREIVKPYLRQVAEAFGMKPDQYLAHFFPDGVRSHTLTRVIMYHLQAREGMRPVGETDGVPLLIKQHNDKSAFTVDSVQTSSGLQYYNAQTKQWENAGTEVACFRGSADSFLPKYVPPTAHRVVFEEGLAENAAPNLVKAGIGRIAIPTFVSPTPI